MLFILSYYYVSLPSLFRVVMSVKISAQKRCCFVFTPVICRRVHDLYLYYLCLFAYSGIQHFVLLNVFKVLVPCCDGRYEFPHKNDVWCSSLYSVVCRICSCLIYVICVYLLIMVSVASWLFEQHGGCLIRGRNCLPLHPQFLMGPVLWHMYPMLPVFLDCPFLIAPSGFSTVYYFRHL